MKEDIHQSREDAVKRREAVRWRSIRNGVASIIRDYSYGDASSSMAVYREGTSEIFTARDLSKCLRYKGIKLKKVDGYVSSCGWVCYEVFFL